MLEVVLIGGPDRETAINIMYAACRQCYYAGFVGEKFPFDDVPFEKKASLVKEIIASHHDSVAEHCVFTFAIKDLSRAAQQQLTRHRAGVVFSVQSLRYNNGNKMGARKAKTIERNPITSEIFDNFINSAVDTYDQLVETGIPKEDARDVLPLSWNSNLVMTMNCRELIHIFELRMCKRAQKEIRDLAYALHKICKERLPEVFEHIGPKCKQLGYCNEGKRSCGMMPLKEDVLKAYQESLQKE